LLCLVPRKRPGGGRCTAGAPDDPGVSVVVGCHDGFHKAPGPEVGGLFAHPSPFGHVTVLVADGLPCLFIDGVELFHPDHSHVMGVLLGHGGHQLMIKFARHKQHATGRRDVARIVDQFAETAVFQFRRGGCCARIAQHAFGGHDDERAAEVAQHLTAQRVEVLRGGAGVNDLDVILGAQRKVAPQPAVGVFGALTLVAVGKQHHQAAVAVPFGEPAGHELVDDDLGAVGEIAELRLPHDEAIGVGHRVTEVESQYRGLGQRTVINAEVSLISGEGREGDKHVAGFLIVHRRMALTESSAAAVLAAQAHANFVQQQAAKSQRLGIGPGKGFAGFNRRGKIIKQFLDFTMDVESVGGAVGDVIGDLLQPLQGHAGFHGFVGIIALKPLPPPPHDGDILRLAGTGGFGLRLIETCLKAPFHFGQF